MPLQTADIIDFQAYRQSRRQADTAAAPVSFAMQPVLMWVPFWGFVPVMAMGIPGYGV